MTTGCKRLLVAAKVNKQRKASGESAKDTSEEAEQGDHWCSFKANGWRAPIHDAEGDDAEACSAEQEQHGS